MILLIEIFDLNSIHCFIEKDFKLLRNYYINNTIRFYQSLVSKRLSFVKKHAYLFDEISSFISNLTNKSKKIIFFGCGNTIILNQIKSEEYFIKEIDKVFIKDFLKEKKYLIEDESDLNKNLTNTDQVLIADIEHQKYVASNLLEIKNRINDDCRVIVISKSLLWKSLLNFIKKLLNFGPTETNFLPFEHLKQIFSNSGFDIIRNEKIIFLPIKIPFVTKFINTIFRLPILNFFCMLNVTILKKANAIEKTYKKISIIIPCKNEEDNIKLFYKPISNFNFKAEFLFGDDNSSDHTLNKLLELKENLKNKDIKIYKGPGVCKSENVYEGIKNSTGDIIAIYDADLTVSFDDLEKSLNYLLKTNSDFINCSRMIIPQKKDAMKKANFLGNIFFALLFSILFKNKITDTLCGTKIFYKKDWENIKKYNSKWGAKDLWGDFDLLIGAYKNNLKISEVPVYYLERKEEDTKMTNVLKNAMRMFYIVISAFYKLRMKK